MRCCDRLIRGWRLQAPQRLATKIFRFGDEGTHGTNYVSLVQRSLLKIIFVYEAQISDNGIIPDLFALTLNITRLAGQTYVWHGCKWNFAGPQIYLQPAKIKSQHFRVSLKFLVCN